MCTAWSIIFEQILAQSHQVWIPYGGQDTICLIVNETMPMLFLNAIFQAKVPIDEAVANIPLVETIRIDKLDLGSRPFRIDSFKSYNTADDEIVIEVRGC